MKKKFDVKSVCGIVLACSALAMSQTAGATVTSAASTGFGAGVSLSLLGNSLLNLALPEGATGAAPDPYSQAKSVVSLDLHPSISLLGAVSASANLTSGIINGAAYSDVDGGMGDKTTGASGSIDGLSISAEIKTLGHSWDILSLHNVTLASSAEIKGDYGTWSSTGLASILGLAAGNDLNVLNHLVDLNAYVDVNGHAAVNTKVDLGDVLSSLGVNLMLNEQIETCFDSICELEVNALHLSIDNLVLGALGHAVVADIKLGHSYAQMSAALGGAPVPVPAAVWLFASGLVGLVGFGRRRAS